MSKKSLSKKQQNELLSTLKERFEGHPERHPDLTWEKVESKLQDNSAALWSVAQMEKSGGEPDAVNLESTGLAYCDCSPESPSERRSLCYDAQALEARKKHKPEDSALNVADSMGIELLTEEQYRQLQEVGEFDLKTSSWLRTPPEIRKRGGAIFGDRRYGRVFIYHNGAESYYAARGFRGYLAL
ncbi:MAG: DUF4256 domain-containing protein [Vulcanimicrobiota bacterium]